MVLLGTTSFPFMADAADSIVRALPRAEVARLPGTDHRWEPADLADLLAGYLGVSGPPAGPGANRSS